MELQKRSMLTTFKIQSQSENYKNTRNWQWSERLRWVLNFYREIDYSIAWKVLLTLFIIISVVIICSLSNKDFIAK